MMKMKLSTFAALAATLSFVGACTPAGEPSSDPPASSETEAPASPTIRAGGTAAATVADTVTDFGDYSLFNLGTSWWDQNGETRELSSLGGRVQVLTMVYTHCGHACPSLISDLKRLESALGPEYADRVGFVLASLDGERDTPERLHRFATDVVLDGSRWTLLGGEEDSVRELAAVLGIRYRRESETEYSHTNRVFVLDQRGEIVAALPMGGAQDDVLATIRAIAG
jgi:protein SCO1/2